MLLLLDTNALIWMAENRPDLGKKSRALIEQPGLASIGYSVVSLYEIGVLATKGRICLSSPLANWRLDLLHLGVKEHVLTAHHAMLATQLAGLPTDPMDRLIAATAISLSATLLTSDKKILAWPGNLDRFNART
jgi:PIN domain nuclease of toxin-antitoxin system